MVYIPDATRIKVAQDSLHRCSYCLTSQLISGGQMHIEHIIPLKHNGTSAEENLCLSCAWCNSYKGTKVSATDPESLEVVPLFNPRTQSWSMHFSWSDDGISILGLTHVGRATVDALRMNNKHILPARRQWVIAGWHPPVDV